MFPQHMLFAALVRWIAAEQHDVIEYLRAENRVPKAVLSQKLDRALLT